MKTSAHKTSLIDTHQHLIYLDRFHYPWVDSVEALKKSFTLDDYEELATGLGIESSLFMEVDVDEKQQQDEAIFFSELSKIEENKLAGVIASGRPENPDFEKHLESVESHNIKGIRRILHVVPNEVSQGLTFRKNIKLLASKNLPFDLCLLLPQHEVGRELLAACPETQFILDHCGNPNLQKPEELEAWQKSIESFAQFENLSAKLSGFIASGVPNQVSASEVHPYLDFMLEKLGADRLVWGSDWPVCNLSSSLPEWVTIFRQWLDTLSESEQVKIGSGNAKRIYNL